MGAARSGPIIAMPVTGDAQKISLSIHTPNPKHTPTPTSESRRLRGTNTDHDSQVVVR